MATSWNIKIFYFVFFMVLVLVNYNNPVGLQLTKFAHTGYNNFPKNTYIYFYAFGDFSSSCCVSGFLNSL